MRLAKLGDEPFTYAEVGATRGTLPERYHHIDRWIAIGKGRRRFEEAGAEVMRYGMLRGAGAWVRATSARAEVGAVVRVLLGPFRAPCRVVYVIDEPDRRGFAYGTLRGHPECGEELFAVRYDPATDAVIAEVRAFSRHATWWSRAGAPVASAVQRMMIARYLTAL